MDVKVFRTFLEVANQKHFGRAAENLYITQAAVSARIKQLETFFDTKLFTRDRNAIKLTSAGERLVSYAEVMVTTLEQAKFELSLDKDKALQLTLGGTPNLWDAYLQNCLSIVTDAFDGYGFIAEVQSPKQLNRNLLDRTLDMAFALEPIKTDDLSSHHIADLDLLLVATEPVDDVEAFDQRYIYVDWGTSFTFEHAERHPSMPAPYMRTSTGRIALDFILEKGGSAYLPKPVVESFIASGQLFVAKGVEEWCIPIYLSYRKQSSSIEAIKKVEKLIASIDPSSAFSLLQAGESGR
ncbi:LysR family transcriptional regulator [Vibrio sp. SCSIO 43136]|uniref:LysR family transcriptional regulator n=1 Tax=Vibrio sp. SCSIO 43136 TaxID=2819101 RepID=UPI002075B5B2|nr:LysR family transcriptional regulator [Vibrio sp. SCSIO 43136]USD67595.1 LysR family transcriptional regulator [Vibrio sp. SCSIO 43136]